MSRFRNLTTALAAALLCAAPSLQAVELQSAGSDTKLSVYGFVWGYADYHFGSAPAGEPVLASSLFYGNWTDLTKQPNNQFMFDIAPTRFGFASTTPSANLGDVQTKIEYDLNGSNSHLRHAWIKFAGWTFGRSWSLFNDLDAGADTVDWAGPVGTACYDTPRYLQVSYVGQIDKNNSFGFSLEQNSGHGDGYQNTAGKAATYSLADYKIPTLVGMYTYAGDWGHIGVRALAQNYGSYRPAVAGGADKDRSSKIEPAFQLSGDVKFGKDDLVWQAMWGKAMGNYGLGFQAIQFNDATQTWTAYKSIGWMVGYTHNWTDKVRSNIILSGLRFSDDDAIATTNGTTGTDLKTAYYGTVNTFVMLTKNLQFGAEYVYEQAKAFGSNDVWAKNDGSLSNKTDMQKIHLALKATF